MRTPLVSTEDLGAWVLKCNAATTDVAGLVAGGGRVERWCVQSNYRTALMRGGQRVIFWVSGSGRGHTAGIWGLGWLAGVAVPQPTGPGAARSRLQVPLTVELLVEAERVDRAVLRADERLRDLEVFRMPQGSNPSFVSRAHLAVIEEYVAWPS